jgi:hypothetical protein
MRTRRRTAEVLLSRPLPKSKPSAAAALPFPLCWAFEGRPLSDTISYVLEYASSKRRARRGPPERARRVSFLSPVGIVGAPASASEESRSNGLALSGSEERDEGQEFGTAADLRPGSSAVNPPATVPQGAAGQFSSNGTETGAGFSADNRPASNKAE